MLQELHYCQGIKTRTRMGNLGQNQALVTKGGTQEVQVVEATIMGDEELLGPMSPNWDFQPHQIHH